MGIDRIGTRIYQVRKRLRLNQAAFGKLLGLSGNAISSYETSDALPVLATLVKIAETGNVTIGWLTMGEEQEPKLTSEELLLLSIFRQAEKDDKDKIIQVAEILSKKNNAAK
jgi:transcriptional regulator with XRE-family HTH domain